MRLRHIAAAGPPEQVAEAIEAAARAGLETAFSAPGLAIALEPGLPRLGGPEPDALLAGSLFRRADGGRVRALTSAMAGEARRSAGRAFVSKYWGSYLLFIREGAERHLVLRDPSGALPAYFARRGGLHLYFSDAEMGLAAGVPASLDLGFARQWLTFPYLRSARTGLEGVSELLPGNCRIVEPASAAILTIWTPWPHAARERQILDFGEAANALRATALEAVPRMVACGGRILLQLSGGLDSSIICAALAQSGASFEAVTYFTRSADGDEREHARAAARAASASLAELSGEQASPLIHRPRARSLRPGANPVLRPLHQALSSHAETVGADLLADGAGGDNIFCYLTTAAPALDVARDRGILSAAGTLRDIAELCGSNVWTAARAALRRHAGARRRPYWREDRMFLAEGAAAEQADPHPWLEAPCDALPGKKEHVEAIVGIQHFLDRGSDELALALAHPLLAQPLLELCLRIPTWLWVKDGRDRAVARAAFAGLLPPEIAARRSKGRLEGLFARSFARSRADLRTLLVGGLLRREGLIDHVAIDAWLRRGGEPRDDLHVRLFEIAALELWMRSWRG